jgi:hypothetical protein
MACSIVARHGIRLVLDARPPPAGTVRIAP